MADVRAQPIDRYIAGDNWLAFYRPHLCGIAIWGHLDAATVTALGAAIAIRYETSPEATPALVDVRHVASVDPAMFQAREMVLAAVSVGMIQSTNRVAIVHGAGLTAAAVIGIRTLAPAPVPEEFFDDPVAALRWLDRERDVELLTELDDLRTAALCPSPLLREVCAMLDANPRIALHEVASAHGLCERTLQRRLADEGTTFQQLRMRATIRIAQRLLLGTSKSVTEIAAQLGYASPQQLATVFAKEIGESPGKWRQRSSS